MGPFLLDLHKKRQLGFPARENFQDKEMTKISILFSLTLITAVHAVPQITPTPTITIGPVRPTEACTCPGPTALCCSSIVDSGSPTGQKVISALGINITGMDVPVGVQCVPFSPFQIVSTEMMRVV